MSEIILKSIDYKIGIRYSSLGVYFGIYNNSHLLFIDNIGYQSHRSSWPFYWPGIPKYVITSIPTRNEVNFIINHKKIDQIFPMLNNVIKKERTHIITIDDLYYRPKLTFDLVTSLWIVNRIY